MRSVLSRALAVAGVALVCCLQLVPFYLTATTALKPRSDLSSPWVLPTSGIHWQNFATALEDGHILRAMVNSAVVTTLSTILVCVLGALAAYPLARRPTLTHRIVFGGIVALIMVPPLSILVPVYSMLAQWGWLNTYVGAVALMVASQLPLSVVLYTAFLRRLPLAMEEAAALDGAGTLRILVRVVLPALRPVTATVIILTCVTVWNEYALSVFILRDPAVRTTAPAIGTFFASRGGDPGAAAAAALLTVVPILIAFVFLQRAFMRGTVVAAER